MINIEKEIIVDPKNPFGGCKLKREDYADVLTQVLTKVPKGCVIALNGAWGTGKTTFVKMWRAKLESIGYRTVYYNAWESDYVTDPLIAIIGELQDSIGKEEGAVRKAVREKIKNIKLSNCINIFASLLRFVPWVNAADAVREINAEINSISDKSLDQYRNATENTKKFKAILSEIIATTTPEKPLVFFIDELDRCNPHYAVKVLERIKHLFSMSHIVFVLSIDKKQLCHSICGYYGNEHIDSEDYLRRFVDLEYLLPEPDTDKFFDYLYGKMDFESIVSVDDNMNQGENDTWRKDFKIMTKSLFKSSSLSLRKMEKMMNHLWLSMQSINKLGWPQCRIFVLLTFLRCFRERVYQKIKDNEYTDQELVTAMETELPTDLFQSKHSNDTERVSTLTSSIISLVMLYHNVNFEHNSNQFFEIRDNKVSKLFIDFTVMGVNDVHEAIIEFSELHVHFDLTSILDRIELTEKLVRSA